MWIASEGQASTQVWQSTHMSLSTLAFSFSMAIADAGHSLTHVSQPVHFVVSTTATKQFTPSLLCGQRQKIGFDLYRCQQRKKVIFFAGRGHRSYHRFPAFYRQPTGPPAGHRSQKPTGHKPGGRVLSFRSSLRTSRNDRPRCHHPG